MTSELITPVILSGGSGTRLWPLSTDDRPKQFLNLTGPLSMFQKTLERCADRRIFAPPVIVGSAKHQSIISDQLNETGDDFGSIILEPCARNTAPAIALAALACQKPQSVMLVMPSDHVISKVDVFLKAVKNSLPLAQARWLVTFGIEPNGPETGYGYIEQGDAIVGSENSFSAKNFVEKPNHDNAEKMLAAGGYQWNAGIFLFRADTYLKALIEFAPQMYEAAKAAIDQSVTEDSTIKPHAESFAATPADSVDYAIMEKAEKVAVTPVDPGWSDVGSWDSLFEIGSADSDHNVINGDAIALNSRNNLINTDGVSISAYGVEDLIIIASGDKVMILPRGQSQDVKKIVERRNNQD